MENIQKQKVGAGILTIAIIHLVLNGIGILGLIGSLALKDLVNESVKEMGVPEITTSALIISMAFIAIITIAVILILMKKEIGVYMYFIVQVANIVYAIVISGFQLVQLISFIMPVLMGIFIWKKKEVFGLGVKVEEVSL
jgi:hypothetical protein